MSCRCVRRIGISIALPDGLGVHDTVGILLALYSHPSTVARRLSYRQIGHSSPCRVSGVQNIPDAGIRDTCAVITPGTYRHYKGNLYEVKCVETFRLADGPDEGMKKSVVLYRALYESGDFDKDTVWCRSLDGFMETVVIEGTSVPRFARVD
jgi:hypothetical protein